MKYWRKPLNPGPSSPCRSQLLILKDRCKGCGFCMEFCPMHILNESPEINKKGYHPVCVENPDKCLNCGLCELICPEFALRLVSTAQENGNVKDK